MFILYDSPRQRREKLANRVLTMYLFCSFLIDTKLERLHISTRDVFKILVLHSNSTTRYPSYLTKHEGALNEVRTESVQSDGEISQYWGDRFHLLTDVTTEISTT